MAAAVSLLRLLPPLLLAVTCVLAAPSITSEEMRMDMMVIQHCNETHPVPLIDMNKALINKKIEPENTVFKCFVFCLLNKYEWMDDEGGFLIANMKHNLSDSHLDQLSIDFLVYKCSATGSSDKCERAYRFTECFWSEVIKFPENSDEKYDDPNLFALYQ
nr:odorant binding protein 18 [Ceracris nigricornis]